MMHRLLTKGSAVCVAVTVTVTVTVMVTPGIAHAQAKDAPVLAVGPADGAIALGAVAGVVALGFIPVAAHRWRKEPLGWDESVRGTWSNTHARIADTTVATSLLMPVVFGALTTGSQHLEKLVIYSETISLTLLLNGIVKYTVHRPRPYTYTEDAEQRAYTQEQGGDAFLSYFSGHSASAFAAATAGSLLYGYGSTDTRARAILWGIEMSLASATGVERVRAGKHFVSDVVVGALVGSAMGIAVPKLHLRDSSKSSVSMLWQEWAAVGGGLVLGTTTALLLPKFPSRASSVQVSPISTESGAGVQLAGTF
jgi:membrane-associated phospholipid phosphatase